MNQKQVGVLLSVIILLASLIGIAMSYNNFLAKKSELEDSNKEVAAAEADYNDAVRDYNNYVNSH